MDPNVQVALVSFLGVIVATTGVVLTAMINNRRREEKESSDESDEVWNQTEMLARCFTLVSELQRKEVVIQTQGAIIEKLRAELAQYKQPPA